MRTGKWYLLNTILLTIVIGSFLTTGCNKYNGIDNNNVVSTPYGVYFADKMGALYNTSDGKAYKMIKSGDGVSDLAIATCGNNLFYIKYDTKLKKNVLAFSTNNGVDFNPNVVSLNSTPIWQNQILDVPDQGRIYSCTNSINGLDYSTDNGVHFQPDGNFGAISGSTMQSLTQLKNGAIFGFDYLGLTLYTKVNNTTLPLWTIVPANTPLPPGKWQISHYNDILVAADYNGTNGVYYSSNFGIDWQPYSGIPTNKKIFVAAGPLNSVLLVGSESGGVYRLVSGVLQQSNNGIIAGTSVYSIVGKQEIYKNQVIKQYVYIATNTGLYRSEDLGQNWVLMRAGDLRSVY